MKNFGIKILFVVMMTGLLSFVLYPYNDALAHPGKTDKKGGHYCKTNCSKWGLKQGQYHYHKR